MKAHLGLVIHRRAGVDPYGLTWYCNPVEGVFATFYLPLSGPPLQLIDDEEQSPLLAAGAGEYASAEVEGAGEPTSDQVAGLAAIYAECHKLHGWPLEFAERPGDSGLMLHSGGAMRFGSHPLCPGPVGELRGQVLSRAAELVVQPEQTLREGDVGPWVAAVQHRLGIPGTGEFSAQTTAVVRAFQGLHGLMPDGVVGPQTLTAMGFAPIMPVRPIGPIGPIGPVAPVGPLPVGPVPVIPDPVAPKPPTPVLPVGPRPFPLPVLLHLPTWVSPVAPGTVAPQPVTIDQPTLQSAMISALGTPYVPAGATPATQVQWFDHDGEVLVHLDATVVNLLSGLVLVALTLETDQTGAGQVTVPLTVGIPGQPTGLLVGTEVRPRGPLVLVDRWGESATAGAWKALLDVASTLARQGGADANGAPFIPAGMTATPLQFSVLPQSRHAMDSVGAQ
jgi:peptidoglycan hydrolase-like protein with peptidoglycan-binding domain